MNKFTGKKLLILGGPTPCCKVVEEAKEMGIYTIVTDMNPNAPAKKLADEALPFSVTDAENIVAWCHENPIDGVVNFCVGLAQNAQQKVSREFGLPCYGSEEQYRILTQKQEFKKLCVENNVDIIKTFKNGNEVADSDFPVFVKPADSSGSRGSTICENRSQLLQAMKEAQSESTTGQIIIEKYMEDYQDLTVTYIVKNGEPMLISIGDRYHGLIQDGLEQQLACTIQPSRYADMYMQYVNERVVKMIKNLGIKNGPVFVQGFVDENTVRFYDPAIRFPGNDYELIYKKATGISPMRSIITYAMGSEIDDYSGKMKGSFDLNGLCAVQYIINLGEGEIGIFEGLNEIRKLPFVLDVKQRYFQGEKVRQTGDVRQRGGEISILIERNSKKIKEAIDSIQSLLKVTDTEGNNMLVSAFDSNIVLRQYKE